MQRRDQNGEQRRIQITPATRVGHGIRIASVEKRGAGFGVDREVGAVQSRPHCAGLSPAAYVGQPPNHQHRGQQDQWPLSQPFAQRASGSSARADRPALRGRGIRSRFAYGSRWHHRRLRVGRGPRWPWPRKTIAGLPGRVRTLAEPGNPVKIEHQRCAACPAMRRYKLPRHCKNRSSMAEPNWRSKSALVRREPVSFNSSAAAGKKAARSAVSASRASVSRPAGSANRTASRQPAQASA